MRHEQLRKLLSIDPDKPLSDEWLAWASQMVQSVDASSIPDFRSVPQFFRPSYTSQLAGYFCGLLMIACRIRADHRGRTYVREDWFRPLFASSLALSAPNSAPRLDAGEIFEAVLDFCLETALVVREERDLWHPGMRSGSGITSFLDVTLAGESLVAHASKARPEPAISANESQAVDDDLHQPSLSLAEDAVREPQPAAEQPIEVTSPTTVARAEFEVQKSEENHRPAYERDHLWLEWKKQGLGGPAKIRDRWDALPEAERKSICPGCYDQVGGKSSDEKQAGCEVVKTALKKAERERGSQEVSPISPV